MKKSKKAPEQDYSDVYKELMKDGSKFIVSTQEWTKRGDVIKRFSMYENYSPVETSGSTTLVNE